MSNESIQPAGGFRTVLNILLEPATAFRSLRERPNSLLPALLVVGGTALAMLWYFAILDIPWFLENLLYQGGAEPSQDQIDAFRAGTEDLSPLIFMISGFFGVIFGILLIWTLQAGYLTLVSALTGDGFRFRNWFCLVTWTAIPTLFTVFGMAVTLLLNSNGQIAQQELDPLLLGNLGLQFGNSAVDNVLAQISLTQLWGRGAARIRISVVAGRALVEIRDYRAAAAIIADGRHDRLVRGRNGLQRFFHRRGKRRRWRNRGQSFPLTLDGLAARASAGL